MPKLAINWLMLSDWPEPGWLELWWDLNHKYFFRDRRRSLRIMVHSGKCERATQNKTIGKNPLELFWSLVSISAGQDPKAERAEVNTRSNASTGPAPQLFSEIHPIFDESKCEI